MKFDVDKLNTLRQRFDDMPDGLSLEDFISVMSQALPHGPEKRLEKSTVQELRELFLQVDVNGDGTMEWGEFTPFTLNKEWQRLRAFLMLWTKYIKSRLIYVDKSRAFISAVRKANYVRPRKSLCLRECPHICKGILPVP